MYFKVENLSFKYEDANNFIFKDFSFSLDKEEILLIRGKSGVGKSSLLKLISGIEKPNRGKILIDNFNIINLEINKRNVGYLFQDFALFPHLNVEQNISYGLSNLSKEERKKRIRYLIELIQLKGFEKRYPSSLSGGEKQRVAMARAIANKPKILLLDEPFSSLNIELKEKLRVEIRNILKSERITTIIVSHDIEDTKIADRIIDI